jgi:protoporphyrinogen oxidase
VLIDSLATRYLYTNGSLLRLPNHPLKVLGSPLMRSAVFAFLREWTVPRSQQPGTPLSPAQPSSHSHFPPTHTTHACLCVWYMCVCRPDESIHSFFTRRFSPVVADTLTDALSIGTRSCT